MAVLGVLVVALLWIACRACPFRKKENEQSSSVDPGLQEVLDPVVEAYRKMVEAKLKGSEQEVKEAHVGYRIALGRLDTLGNLLRDSKV